MDRFNGTAEEESHAKGAEGAKVQGLGFSGIRVTRSGLNFKTPSLGQA
ncbi:MAG: hypothetical protein H7Y43_08320 [Akkermansiaceae bacterium]|nr:hypothetical protein [Verrucomicrobiales bacterium]